ncbi:MAG: thioredoxin family protein [Muribaculaceae bacterium]|nr:thioredoxin family protein [Muribaculaceae bacterium]
MDYTQTVNSNPVVLVEFYATWCPHCQRMMPVVEKVKKQLEGRVPVYQYDIDKNESIADDAKVQSIPTFLIYVNGEVAWRHSGEIEGDVLLDKVESYLK